MLMAIIYVVGAVIGLIATDGNFSTRLALSLLWPIGPLAFVVTVGGLLVVAAIAFPVVGFVLAGAAAAFFWLA